MISRVASIVVVLFAILLPCVSSAKYLKEINDDNWRDILQGEWMIEFQAPWCPACRNFAKTWISFAEWSKDMKVDVAVVDVTAQPGLSGRFLVTSLPTIYHVKDGVFRVYAGSHDQDDLISFIEEKKWTIIDPVPSWKYPDSIQMSVLAWFFKLSKMVRDLHDYLVEKQGLPSLVSYAVMGMGALLLACIVATVMIFIIDCMFFSTPLASPGATDGAGTKKGDQQGKKQSDQKDKDELSDIDVSQASEEASQHSQTEEEEEEEESQEDTVRQRKGQKKDKDSSQLSNKNQTPDTSPKNK